MPQDIISQFDRKFNFPIETDRTVTTLTARNAIDPSTRWEGMIVYVEQDEKNYFLKGGILNTDWQEFELPDNAVLHLGNYDASTNTPVLTDISGSLGQSYKIIGAATETNVDFGGGNIPLTNNDFILHDGSNWTKYINNNQSGGSVTLLPSIVDGSTDGVESNAIYDTIKNNNAQGLQNGLFAQATIKGIEAPLFGGLGSITYDRDIILSRTLGGQFCIIKNSLTGFEEFKATQDSRWRLTVFDRNSTNSGMSILQNFYSNELRSAVGETVGVPPEYTAYIFNNSASPWFGADFDIPIADNAMITMSLTFSPPINLLNGSGTTANADSIDLLGSLNKDAVINMGDPDDTAYSVEFDYDGSTTPTVLIQPDNFKFESGDSLLQATGNSTKLKLGGIPTVVGEVPVWTNVDGTLGSTPFSAPTSVVFTPVLTDLGGGATYAGNFSGQGFKIGDWFWFNIFCFSITTTGTPTGNFVVTGFPDLASTTTAVTVGQFLGTSTTPDFDMITAIIDPSSGQSRVTFNIKPANSGTPNLIALQDVVFGTVNAAICISGGFIIQQET